MSDRYDDDDFNPDEDNSPAGLRAALKKAKADAKKAEERATAAEQRAADAEKTVKKSTLKDLLESKGVKPGLARWLEKDDVEATPEAVDAWLKENGEFFNVKAEAPTDDAGEEHEEQGGDEGGDQIPEDLSEALKASQRLDEAGVSPSAVGTMQRLAALKTDPAKGSYEDLVAQMAELGAPLDV